MELVKQFAATYMAALKEMSEDENWKARKRKAFATACALYPEVSKAVEGHMAHMHGKGPANQVGQQAVLECARQVGQVYGRNVNSPKSADNDSKPMAQLYREWLAEEDYMPADEVLSHFTGMARSTFASARSVMSNTGAYKFVKNGHGWNVEKVVQPVKAFSNIEKNGEVVRDLNTLTREDKLAIAASWTEVMRGLFA